jgi:mercuric ion transport protein
MHRTRDMINDESRVTSVQRSQRLLAAAGVLGAIAASSCCVLPLALFGVGVSGAWIASLTVLAPWQPWLIAATIGLLGTGYWLAYHASKSRSADPECRCPLPGRTVSLGLFIGTLLVIVTLGVNAVSRFLIDL